jgi:diguanylate cyclase (GGDEF)-like protein
LALAHNHLGIAYFWSKDFERASATLKGGLQACEAMGDDGLATQILLNMVATEVASAFDVRYHLGKLPPMAALSTALARLDKHITQAAAFKFSEGLQPTGKAVHCYFSAMLSCWTGEPQDARSFVKRAYWWTSKYPVKTWLDVLASWCSAEILWAEGRLDAAILSARQTVDLAAQLEHEQMGTIGRLLLCQLFEVQGDLTGVQRELKALRRREAETRIEGLRSRALAVSWHVDMRQNAHNLKALEIGARDLERLSNEDVLTGLANRRLFERRARDLLAVDTLGLRPLCIVLIDVDKFKTVNDNHSHAVGDVVLKTIADVLKSSVRECDVAARLAGDEFVLALADLELPEAEQVCKRVCESVRNFPWSEVAPGLAVTVSAELSQALSGEAFEDLLHRSDMEMYSSKRSKAPAAAS